MPCTDIEDRGNRYTYPYSWLVAESNGYKPNNSSTNGFVNKNRGELEAGLRYLRDGNIYEGTSGSGGEGDAFTSKVWNGSGTNYFLSTTNVTMTNLIARGTCLGTSFGDSGSTTSGDGGGQTIGVYNVLLGNSLFYNIGSSNPGCAGFTNIYGVRPGGGEVAWSCTADWGPDRLHQLP